MDNLTHGLAGLAMGRLFPQHWGRWVLPTAAVTANLPDFEALFVSISDKPNYLIQHRAWSHSVIGVVLESLILATLLLTVLYWSGHRTKPARKTWLQLFSISLCGAVLHVFMDWWNTYGIRPLYPFQKEWLYGDLAFIIDPWMWWMLGTGFLLGVPPDDSSCRPRFRRVLAAVAGLLWVTATGIIAAGTASAIVPAAVLLTWLALWAVTVGMFRLIRSRLGPRRWAVASMSLVALYLTFSAVVGTACRSDAQTRAFATVDNVSVHVHPGIPWRIEVICQQPEALVQFSYDLLRNDAPVGRRSIPRRLELAASPAVHRTREYRAWKIFARHPVAWSDGGRTILGDGRYQVFGRDRDWSAMAVPVGTQEN